MAKELIKGSDKAKMNAARELRKKLAQNPVAVNTEKEKVAKEIQEGKKEAEKKTAPKKAGRAPKA